MRAAPPPPVQDPIPPWLDMLCFEPDRATLSVGGGLHEAARFHHAFWRGGGLILPFRESRAGPVWSKYRSDAPICSIQGWNRVNCCPSPSSRYQLVTRTKFGDNPFRHSHSHSFGDARRGYAEKG